MRATLLAVGLALGLGVARPNTSRWEAPMLVVHLSHNPANETAARLAEAVRKACDNPSMKCRVAPPLEATTFLHLSAQREEPAGDNQAFLGLVDIKSRLMMPGSISARDRSIERLAVRLLASVKERQAKGAGVIQLRSPDIAR